MSLESLFSSLSNSISVNSKSGNSAKSDPKSLLSGLLGSGGAQGALGGAASGALVSLLMNGKARNKIQKNAVKVGGMAAIAGVGYYAYQKWQQSRQDSPPPVPSQAINAPVTIAADTPPPLPADLATASFQVKVTGELPMKMVLAMIAAAAADGTIDSVEMTALADAIDTSPLEPAEKGRLTSALNLPPTVEEIAGLANGPEEASEIYGAALTAIEVDTPSEHLFLRRLSRALKLDDQLTATVHETLEKA
ncbi:tellurite resistance TerB family protein [Luteolibacter arcticus]|uniref:Tellurite resistance TerB family protein n=1 Tax=Luteolibacter arcticus TaxID=1581411 RepID=A0ABT3GNB6_9BACT|nr:tellurite resistance TerB family protein [Luteolibacter arcticus]MCW1924984.1 tellurite resistance TerB family protein [Luteolibacter arcticus]